MDLARLVEEEFLRPQLSARHEVFGFVRFTEDRDGERPTPAEFADTMRHALDGLVESVRHDVSRYKSGVISATVERHTKEDVSRPATDFRTGEKTVLRETRHDIAVKFVCTGEANYEPRAVALRRYDSWLLVDSAKYLEVGMCILTPAGERVIAVIDTFAHPTRAMIKVDGSLRGDGFEIYRVGDAGAPKEGIV
jgi:hypothetical protein